MATLDVTRGYEDGETLTEAHLDAIRTDIQTLFNTTKLNDDNIQNSGITGSLKLVAGSVTAAKLASSSVTSVKIQDDAVTTAKIADSAVRSANIADNALTTAKLETLFKRAVPGMIVNFHTYNAELDIPRGWMICDGDIINEANYEATHGAGTYTTDAIAGSAIVGKYLPNFTDKYAYGTGTTTQDGSVAITSSGANTQNLAHTHTISSHLHQAIIERAGDTGDVTRQREPTGSQSTTLETTLSAAQDVRPASIRMLFLMKVV